MLTLWVVLGICRGIRGPLFRAHAKGPCSYPTVFGRFFVAKAGPGLLR